MIIIVNNNIIIITDFNGIQALTAQNIRFPVEKKGLFKLYCK